MAEEVIPHFREPDGKPSWMRAEPPGPRRSPSMRRPWPARLRPLRAAQRQPGETQRAYREEWRRPERRTEDLRSEQERRRRRRSAARARPTPRTTPRQHARRAEKSDYLREKLAERERPSARSRLWRAPARARDRAAGDRHAQRVRARGRGPAGRERAREPCRRSATLIERAREEDVPIIYVNDNYGDWNSSAEKLARAALNGRHPDWSSRCCPSRRVCS